METTRTVICKLAPTFEQAADIDATLKAFAGACDFAADAARRIGSTNKIEVQKVAYREIRKTMAGIDDTGTRKPVEIQLQATGL